MKMWDEVETWFIAFIAALGFVGFLVAWRMSRPFSREKCATCGQWGFDTLSNEAQRCRKCKWVTRKGLQRVILCATIALVTSALFSSCERKLKPFKGADIALELREGVPAFGLPEGPEYSRSGRQLLLDFEVGGGEQYYETFLAHPVVPPEASGVTIGVGYDLRFVTRQVALLDWWELKSTDRIRLAECTQLSHEASLRILPKVRDIYIPWKIAEGVFDRVWIARHWQQTKRAFPGVEKLYLEAQWVCLSIVSNRGPGMAGPRRAEMREIRDAVVVEDYRAMAKANRQSIRIWSGGKAPGLVRRRNAESLILDECAKKYAQR